jgi:hypothetical protein
MTIIKTYMELSCIGISYPNANASAMAQSIPTPLSIICHLAFRRDATCNLHTIQCRKTYTNLEKCMDVHYQVSRTWCLISKKDGSNFRFSHLDAS